ncbi:MAG: hypothetical protein HGB35_05575, partial [Geobacteraceae bacterium]|nr:hypothetical protein [Geobacteraceae bacterium]
LILSAVAAGLVVMSAPFWQPRISGLLGLQQASAPVTDDRLTALQGDVQALSEKVQAAVDQAAVSEAIAAALAPLSADLEVSLSKMTGDVLKYLDYLQPTGYGNPDAVFVSRNLQVKASRTVGAEAKHLKLTLSDGRVTYDAIGFRLGSFQSQMPQKVDVMYTFETNEYNGRVSLQLNLKDVKRTGDPDAG